MKNKKSKPIKTEQKNRQTSFLKCRVLVCKNIRTLLIDAAFYLKPNRKPFFLSIGIQIDR